MIKKKGDKVMISTDANKNLNEEDGNAIEETLYLNSIPGMAESIIAAGNISIEDCTTYNPDEEW